MIWGQRCSGSSLIFPALYNGAALRVGDLWPLSLITGAPQASLRGSELRKQLRLLQFDRLAEDLGLCFVPVIWSTNHNSKNSVEEPAPLTLMMRVTSCRSSFPLPSLSYNLKDHLSRSSRFPRRIKLSAETYSRKSKVLSWREMMELF